MSGTTAFDAATRQQMVRAMTRDYLDQLERCIAQDPPPLGEGRSIAQCAAFSAMSHLLGLELERAGQQALEVLVGAVTIMRDVALGRELQP
ncbi:hypothetical protein [Komagataeibacter xylinus]|uniref:Uncharacterized protein n=1 Tax=Komagataeibacter xylinus TaxID=28448 RepID=A0A857FPC6_KOMXY|nr:hypothetical protein [Komagataeibacter xylinus]QHC36026.1 hypothetical protein FMA36_11460 [Komagataeibacter xylinus]